MTRKKNKLQWYNDLTLEMFYHSMATYGERIKLPHHDVIYVRAAIRAALGESYTYERVYHAMKAE